jgi:hypothetical protein
MGGRAIANSSFLYGVCIAVVAIEVTPLNEVLRLAAFGASQILSPGALTGALTYGTATLAIEALAALAAAQLLASRVGSGVMSWVQARLTRFVSPETRMSTTVEIAIAMLGGTAVVLLAKNAQERGRSLASNRRYGLAIAGALAGICAIQGALMGTGIAHPSPPIIGLVVLTVVGFYVAARRLVRRASRSESRPSATLGSSSDLDP